ncbi:helix-turn-helix domain-containing protein [Phyllobacterium myrsinacearum]|uniref:Chromosomal replication initiation ATPase DnaA n=1 Tax=Phyllobacterium myrsinacearum TaxID=28101 RepID=A0A839EA09_9HYPH|nr:helix-turn-helix domain-containing protein [Phyllobacterium myrsinacearum]MBA8876711.1 chromosomal replication initiation ATPase DnaA [Phyllobacterium myrsinacearum]
MSENFPHVIRSAAEARAVIDILRQGRSRQKAIKPYIPDDDEPLDERLYQVCDSVIDILSSFFNVSGRDLRSHSRCERSVARVRQIGMYAAHVALSLSMSEVGRAFGRDRSTVHHACHLIEDMRDEPEFDRIIQTIENILRAAFISSGMVRR